ncbi:MAG: hypothetical protein J6B44_05405 [Muribaculaceae bacterium]|nr:hypothetical protein [Muribaculaceae bacterium]
MKLILLCIAIVAISVLLLGVRVLFVKGGRFPSPHISDSAQLRRRGITCAHSDNK